MKKILIILFWFAGSCALAQPSVPISYSLSKLEVAHWFSRDLDSLLFKTSGSYINEALKNNVKDVYFDVSLKAKSGELFCDIELYRMPPIPFTPYFGYYSNNGHIYLFLNGNPNITLSKVKEQKKVFHTKGYRPNEIPIIYDPPREIFKVDLINNRLYKVSDEEILRLQP